MYICDESNIDKIKMWLDLRGGILIWKSADLSDPSFSMTTPYLNADGEISSRPHWKCENNPSEHIVSYDEVVITTPKEYKRFKVGVLQRGFSYSVTDAGSRRIRKELEDVYNKTGKTSYYVFDYFAEKNCVIMIDDKTVPMLEYLENRVK